MVNIPGDSGNANSDRPPRRRRITWLRVILWLCGNLVGGGLASAGLFALGIWPAADMDAGRGEVVRLTRKSQATKPIDRMSTSSSLDTTASASDQLEQADVIFLSGNHGGALLAYDQLLTNPEASVETSLQYRRALCLELLGKMDEASAVYRVISDTGRESAVADAALLGQIRARYIQGRYEQARNLLQARLLTSGRRPEVVPHLLHAAALLASAQLRPVGQTLLDDTGIVASSPYHREKDLLQLAGSEPNVNAAPSSLDVSRGISISGKFSDHPRDIHVDIDLESQPVTDLLKLISREADLSLEMHETAESLLSSRAITVFAQDISLASVLDSVLEPAGLFWTSEDGRVSVYPRSQADAAILRTYRTQKAIRLARGALALYPESPTARTTYLCLGNVSFWSGEYTDALSAYSALEHRGDDREFAFAVYFNKAKTLVQLNREEEARTAFFRAIDGLGGEALEPIAYVHLGRLFLEDAQVENANRQLARSLTLARTDKVRRVGAVILACSYLQAANPQAANQTLVDHRSVLGVEPAQSQAAFVSALARFRAAVGSTERLRRARDLANSLVSVEASRFMGTIGYLLVGQAYSEIGLPDQMLGTLKKGIEASPVSALRDEMLYLVAEHYSEWGMWPEAEETYEQLASEGQMKLAQRARFGLAELDFARGQYDSCLRRAYELLTTTSSVHGKSELLRLMGRAYERQADHYKAAICFAGMLPSVPPEPTPLNN